MTAPPDQNETLPHPHLLCSILVFIAKRRTNKQRQRTVLSPAYSRIENNMKWLWDMYSQITLFYEKGGSSSGNICQVGLVRGVRVLMKMLHYARSKKCSLVVQLPS